MTIRRDDAGERGERCVKMTFSHLVG